MKRFTRIDPEEHQGTVISLSPVLLKVEDFQETFKRFFISKGFECINAILLHQGKGQLGVNNRLFEQDGINCEVLQPGKTGWEKGKLRIRVSFEFLPDEPDVEEIDSDLENLQEVEIEFPLDEVRKEISNL